MAISVHLLGLGSLRLQTLCLACCYLVCSYSRCRVGLLVVAEDEWTKPFLLTCIVRTLIYSVRGPKLGNDIGLLAAG
jgi:hypothetical protein